MVRASERANVRVLALRMSTYGKPGEPTPVHPHLFRHARVPQIVRTTESLPIAQRQAGWSRLQMAYLSVSDDESARRCAALKFERAPNAAHPVSPPWMSSASI
jgi:hypothetical protein